ncbi:MAG: c-type cytochrome, partial [Bdellovibrionota bacterium]
MVRRRASAVSNHESPDAADPSKGQKVYEAQCIACHGKNGEGRWRADGKSFEFPPLWGKQAWSVGTSMSRLSILARFVKGNMPFNSTTKLSDEDAWNVSAYVLSQKRPPWKGIMPFPVLSSKPFDYPIGPYADRFSEAQHRLGPFKPIIDYWTATQGAEAALSASGI